MKLYAVVAKGSSQEEIEKGIYGWIATDNAPDDVVDHVFDSLSEAESFVSENPYGLWSQLKKGVEIRVVTLKCSE